MQCPNCGGPMGAMVNESGYPVYVCTACNCTVLM